MKVAKELIVRLKEGDMLVFESVYQLYSAHVYNFINSLLRNDLDAEDLTQEVFVRLWENRESIDLNRNIDSYIFTIARNLVYDQWRSYFHADHYLESILQENRLDSVSGLEEHLIAGSIGQFIDELIEKLPESRREIFLLSRKHHLSNKEIAQHLSISERTVETQIYRSLQFLRKYLGKEGIITAFLCLIVNE